MTKRLLLSFVFLTPLFNTYSTVIVQENGDVVTGVVKEMRETSILFHSRYGDLTIEKNKIKKIIQDESAIKTETLDYKGNKIEVRFLFEDAGVKVYMDSSGKIIRVLLKEQTQKPQTEAITPAPVKRSKLGIYGGYGIMKQPYPLYSPTAMAWEYDTSFNKPGFGITYAYYPAPVLGIGLDLSNFYQNPESKYKVDGYEVTVKSSHAYYGLNLLIEFSIMGALGISKDIHDFGAGVVAGISFVQSRLTMETDFSSDLKLAGTNFHFSGGGYLFYSIKFSALLGLFIRAQYQIFPYQFVYEKEELAEDQDSAILDVQSKLNQLATKPFDVPQGFSISLGVHVFF